MAGVFKLRLPSRLMARFATLGGLRVSHLAVSVPVATLAPSPGAPGFLPPARSRWEVILGPNTILGRAVRMPLWVAMMGIPVDGAGLSVPHRTKESPPAGVGGVLARLSTDEIAVLAGSPAEDLVSAMASELGRRGGDDVVPVLRQLLMRTGHLAVVAALLGISGEAAIAAVVAYGSRLDKVSERPATQALIEVLQKTSGDASTAVLLALTHHDLSLLLKTAIGKILAARGVAVTDIGTLLLLAPAQLVTETAVPALLEITLRTTSLEQGQAALRVLQSIPGQAATAALVRVLRHGNDQIAVFACQSLLKRPWPFEDAIPELLDIVREKPIRSLSAVLILSGISGEAATAALVTCLGAVRIISTQLDIIHELERRHAVAAVPELERLASEMRPAAFPGGSMIAGGAALDAVKALVSLPGDASTSALVRVLQASEDNDVLKMVAEALGRRGAVAAIPRLEEIARAEARARLSYTRQKLIDASVEALSKIPGEAATAAMFRLLEDRKPAVLTQGAVLLALDRRHAFSEDRIPLLVGYAKRCDGQYAAATELAARAIQVLAKISGDAYIGILQDICMSAPSPLIRDTARLALAVRGVRVEDAPSAPQEGVPTVDEIMGQLDLVVGGRPVPGAVQRMTTAPVPSPPPVVPPEEPSPKPPPVVREQVDTAFAAIQVLPDEINNFVRLLAITSAGALPILWALAGDAEYRDRVAAALTLLQTWHREQNDPNVPDTGRALLRVQDAGRTESSLELD